MMIKRDNLLQNAIDTGAHLVEGLEDISKDYPEWIKNIRGKGTFLAYDQASEANRGLFVKTMRENGVN
jgi:4-aminobutyrate aminotransferase/(S)-3-amino-2-methylpropionate transaminase